MRNKFKKITQEQMTKWLKENNDKTLIELNRITSENAKYPIERLNKESKHKFAGMFDFLSDKFAECTSGINANGEQSLVGDLNSINEHKNSVQ